ncbi:MAG: hypothetical protein IKD15_00655 [Clostridia bacterium]|nr:hypothetical protein [Clostridia bacterium]
MEKMENKTSGEVLTKEEKGLILTAADAEEYYAYKKQKKINEIMGAMSQSEGVIELADDAQRAMERASRLRQAAVRMKSARFLQARGELSRRKIAADCLIGESGETLARVKAYEMKLVRKMGASELTVALTPSLIDACRYNEIRKELRILKRAVKKCVWKVWVDGHYPYTTLMRIARLVSEAGANFFSVPYFAGCEQLRFELYKGCRLEVVGVDTLADFKKMIGAGIGRIVTSRGYELYTQWLKEADKIQGEALKKTEQKPIDAPQNEVKKEEKAVDILKGGEKKNPETDYRCRIEDGELKFL